MNNKICPICNNKMKRNGYTKSGTQRWRCRVCGTSTSHTIDTTARDLKTFVNWLMSNNSQLKMPGDGRTFRRKSAQFWKIWPMPDVVDEIHRVVFVDGIWIERNVVILIACTEQYILSWYLARAETTQA